VSATPTTAVVDDKTKPWKAAASAAVAFLSLLWINLQGDGKQDQLTTMTVQDWLTVLIPTIIAFGATYLVPNPKVRR
jgi:hypothetical protein